MFCGLDVRDVCTHAFASLFVCSGWKSSLSLVVYAALSAVLACTQNCWNCVCKLFQWDLLGRSHDFPGGESLCPTSVHSILILVSSANQASLFLFRTSSHASLSSMSFLAFSAIHVLPSLFILSFHSFCSGSCAFVRQVVLLLFRHKYPHFGQEVVSSHMKPRWPIAKWLSRFL